MDTVPRLRAGGWTWSFVTLFWGHKPERSGDGFIHSTRNTVRFARSGAPSCGVCAWSPNTEQPTCSGDALVCWAGQETGLQTVPVHDCAASADLCDLSRHHTLWVLVPAPGKQEQYLPIWGKRASLGNNFNPYPETWLISSNNKGSLCDWRKKRLSMVWAPVVPAALWLRLRVAWA